MLRNESDKKIQLTSITESVDLIAKHIRKGPIQGSVKLQYSKSQNQIIINGSAPMVVALNLFLAHRGVKAHEEPVDASLVEKLQKIAADLPKSESAPVVVSRSTVLFSESPLHRLENYITRNSNNKNKEDIRDRIKQGYIRLDDSDRKKLKQFIQDAFTALPEQDKIPQSASLSTWLKVLLFAISVAVIESRQPSEDPFLKGFFALSLFMLLNYVMKDEPKLPEKATYYNNILQMAERHDAALRLSKDSQPAVRLA